VDAIERDWPEPVLFHHFRDGPQQFKTFAIEPDSVNLVRFRSVQQFKTAIAVKQEIGRVDQRISNEPISRTAEDAA